jgi:hypothetical protein
MFSSSKEVSIIPFHWTHPFHMDLREFEKAYFTNVSDYPERLKAFAMAPHCYTALHKGAMACCFGFNELWPGVAEGWLLTTPIVERNPISLTRGAIRVFNHVAIEMRLHRLQLVVDARNQLAINWATALKFNPEGRLSRYGPDQSDHIMYARNYG